MADFCQEYSRHIFGEDFGDMRGITRPIDTLFGRYARVLCEECGPTLVDHAGKCILHGFCCYVAQGSYSDG